MPFIPHALPPLASLHAHSYNIPNTRALMLVYIYIHVHTTHTCLHTGLYAPHTHTHVSAHGHSAHPTCTKMYVCSHTGTQTPQAYTPIHTCTHVHLCVHIGMMQCSPTAHTHARAHTAHTCAHLHSEHVHVSMVHTCTHLHSTHTCTHMVHTHAPTQYTCTRMVHTHIHAHRVHACARLHSTRICAHAYLSLALLWFPGWPCPYPVPNLPRALSGWVCAEAVRSHLMAGILGVLRAAAPSGLHFSEAPASPGDEGAGTLSFTIGTLLSWALGSGPSRTTTYNHCLLGHLGWQECQFAPPDHTALPSCPGSGGDLCGPSWPCQPGRAGAREVGPHACPPAPGLGSPRAWLSRSLLPAPTAPAGPGDRVPAVSSPPGLWNWPTLLTPSLLSGWLCPHLQLP